MSDEMNTPAAQPTTDTALPTVQPVATPVSAPRSRTTTILAAVAIIEGVIILVLLAVLAFGAMSFFGPYGPGIWPMAMGEDWEEQERVWMIADEASYEINMYLQDGDTEGYMSLYDESDPSVDFDKMRTDFEELADKASEAEADLMPGMTELFEDVETGETLARVSFELSDWDTGRTIGRIRTFMLVPEQDGEDIQLTGREGRDLESSGMPF